MRNKRGHRFRDITGKTFQQITVVSLHSIDRNKSTRWNCICSCGKPMIANTDHLTRKNKPLKSCGCSKRPGPTHPLFRGYGEISSSFFSNIKRHCAKGNGKRRAVLFKITIKYLWKLFLRQNRRCVYSNQELFFSSCYGRYEQTASLDRIDSSKGYIRGNVQWVHKDINMMKRILSHTRFIELCKLVAEAHKDKANASS